MSLSETIVTYAADVGKPKNLGWARRSTDTKTVGEGLNSLAEAMASDASHGLSIAIGFESPLFLPLAQQPEELLTSRGPKKEGRRPWSAGAGPAATVSGIVAMTWIFRRFRELVKSAPTVYVDWNAFVKAEVEYRVFVWEAFVSERQQDPIDVLGEPARDDAKWAVKEGYHLIFDKADALTAVNDFVDRLGQPTDFGTGPNAAAMSLVHSVVSRLGWSTDHVPAHLEILVRKAHKPNWDCVPELLKSAGMQMPVSLEECFTLKKK